VPAAIVPQASLIAGRPSLTAVGLSAVTAVALISHAAVKRNLTPIKNRHPGYMHHNESGGAAGWEVDVQGCRDDRPSTDSLTYVLAVGLLSAECHGRCSVLWRVE